MKKTLVSNVSFKSKIGEGYFGEVYEAEDPVRGRVAAKVIKKATGESDDDWKERKAELLREGQHLREAEHRNVVPVFQVLEAEDDDAVVLVMDYCEGGSLEVPYEAGPMTLADVRTVLTQAAMGLHAIHERGMVHRDIKPANLLVDSDGVVNVADFGLVTDELIHGYADDLGYTDHLALEVFTDNVTSIRTDVWAFGMTAYRLLHGHTFYNFELPERPRFVIQDGSFAQKLPWLPHIPDRWRRFIRKAMRDESGDRYQNAVELLRALENLPISPSWECQYATNRVIWERKKGDRLIDVTWDRLSERRHKWSAVSYPLVTGRKRRLDGSSDIIGKTQVRRDLTDFFARQ